MAYHEPQPALSPSPAGTFSIQGNDVVVAASGQTTSVIPRPRRTPIDAHTLASFKLDEATGPFVNEVPAAGNLTVSGNWTPRCISVYGGRSAIRTTAADGVVGGFRAASANAVWEPTSITLSMWVMVKSWFGSGGTAGVFVMKNLTQNAWGGAPIYMGNPTTASGLLGLYAKNEAGDLSIPVPQRRVPLGEWHLWALTYESPTLRFYFDGVELGNASNAGGDIAWGSHGEWFLGNVYGASNVCGDYYASDFRIEDVARSGSYLRQVYEAARPR